MKVNKYEAIEVVRSNLASIKMVERIIESKHQGAAHGLEVVLIDSKKILIEVKGFDQL